MAYHVQTRADRVNRTTAGGADLLVPKPKGAEVLPHQLAGDSIVYHGRGDWYLGQPPEELIARDDVAIRTVENDPWPGSAEDRLAQTPRNTRLDPHPRGLPRTGPGYMMNLERAGLWPSPRCQELDEYKEAKLRDPEGTTRFLLEQQGLRPEELEARVAKARRAGRMSGRPVPVLVNTKRTPKAAS